MPGPRGLPRETVSPEVSECSRIERSRRPTRTATSAWPASWTTVTPSRTRGQVTGAEHEEQRHRAGRQHEARLRHRLGRRGAVPDLAQHRSAPGEPVGPHLAEPLGSPRAAGPAPRSRPALDQRHPAARLDADAQPVVEQAAVDTGVPRLGTTAAPHSRWVPPAMCGRRCPPGRRRAERAPGARRRGRDAVESNGAPRRRGCRRRRPRRSGIAGAQVVEGGDAAQLELVRNVEIRAGRRTGRGPAPPASRSSSAPRSRSRRSRSGGRVASLMSKKLTASRPRPRRRRGPRR